MKLLKETKHYKIDNTGQIYNCKSGKKLSMNEYIHLDKPRRTKKVVANNLLDNPNNYKHIINIDGDKNNNLVSNLMWAETVYGDPIISKKDDLIVRGKISVHIRRCYDENSRDYMSYGSKGITIHDDWLVDTLEFVKWSKDNGYYRGAWLIRYDKLKGFTPDNCFWGKPNQCFKLDCNMVEDIKNKFESMSHNKVADKYQVSRERIRQIRRGGTLKNCR